MATISLYQTDAFDAQYDHSISFFYVGNQPVKNRLTIYEALTNTIVYNEEVVTLKLSHIIPANTLLNGGSYNYTVTAYDISDDYITSSKVSFICLKTPVWNFSNILPHQIVRNMKLQAIINYQQEQNEIINEYKVELYSSASSLIWDSGIKYDFDLMVEITGLTNNSIFYIRALGKTVNGLNLDTGLVPFSVEYKTPPLYSTMYLKNKQLEGLVEITSNIIGLSGSSEPELVNYVDNEMVDLSNGEIVSFNEGINLNGDFTTWLVGKKLNLNNWILKVQSNDDYFNVYWKYKLSTSSDGIQFKHAFIEIQSQHYPQYALKSNYIKMPKVHDLVFIRLRRINGLFDLLIENISPETIYPSGTWGALANRTWGEMRNKTWADVKNIAAISNRFHGQNAVNDNYTTSTTPLSDAIITSLSLSNGVFDSFYVSKNTDSVYIPGASQEQMWDFDTVLFAEFHNNLYAGNTELSANDINSVIVKRRKYNTLNWVSLFSIPIDTFDDFNFKIIDYTPRSKTKYEYALVPMSGTVEGDYITAEIETSFQGLFITGRDQFFSTELEVEINSQQQNKPTSVVVTMDEYPFVISHGKSYYKSGNTTALFVEFLESSCIYDFENSWKYRERLNRFLYNGLPKLLKHWDGRMWLIAVSSDTISESQGGHENIVKTSFEWTEIADCDKNNALYECGFIDVKDEDLRSG